MTTKIYNPEAHYLLLSGWWEKWWGHAPSRSSLPMSGVIVTDDESYLAAGFLYLDVTSPVGLLSWLVTNPEITAREKAAALKVLTGGIKELAKSQGRSVIMAAFPQGGLTRLLEGQGYKMQDTKMAHLTLNVEGGES